PDVYSRYKALLLDSGDGVAVTTARDELCSGCDMHIPPQLYVEIRKNEDIIQCPQCRRILYSSED
ncbi:MAG: C4-type zinc ribbon domain-containing protein, partial [Nitrospirota bacterium]|nr:C4-type zinc ribbon domain-containing protein [Nitrospirota bacterium]